MGSREIYNTCRLCLHQSQYLTNIFEVNVNQSYVLAEVIENLLQYPVLKNDGYPQYVCTKCSDKLIEFTIFKEQCLESKVAYGNLFAPRKWHIPEEQQVEVTPSITIKSEPDEDTDNEEIEVQVDPNPANLVKQEIIVDDSPNKVDASPVRWGWSGSNLLMEVTEPSVEMAEQMRFDHNRQLECSYRASCITEHAIQNRIMNVQSLAGGSSGCYGLNMQHPVEIWQPISETSEERKRRLTRERTRKFRAGLTPEQIMMRRMLDTQRTAMRRQNETPMEREKRRMMDAYRTARRRLNETPEQKAERRRLDKLRHAWRRQSLTTG